MRSRRPPRRIGWTEEDRLARARRSAGSWLRLLALRVVAGEWPGRSWWHLPARPPPVPRTPAQLKLIKQARRGVSPTRRIRLRAVAPGFPVNAMPRPRRLLGARPCWVVRHPHASGCSATARLRGSTPVGNANALPSSRAPPTTTETENLGELDTARSFVTRTLRVALRPPRLAAPPPQAQRTHAPHRDSTYSPPRSASSSPLTSNIHGSALRRGTSTTCGTSSVPNTQSHSGVVTPWFSRGRLKWWCR